MLDLLKEHNLIATNTLYCKPDSKIVTFREVGTDITDKTFRNIGNSQYRKGEGERERKKGVE